MKIDLHCHTNLSDGHLTPEEIVDRAHNMQVDVLAITDHDSMAALPRARAHQATQKRPLTLIPGVEISTRWHGFDIHVLGLNVDPDNSEFKEHLTDQSHRRDNRARKIAEKLEKAGIEGVLEDALNLAGAGQITRSHFAQALVNRGVVNHPQKAFDKYLGKGKRAFVAPDWIEVDTAIDWIHGAGGMAVLAHPGHYDLSAKWLRRLLVQFKSAGGDGMEVNHSNLTPDRQRFMAELAREYGLLASKGSDFHFPTRWHELGRNQFLPEDLPTVWSEWPQVAVYSGENVMSTNG